MNPSLLELSPALRRLVDNRLDTIEQMLVQGQTSRSERKSILEDLETQILDMVSAEAPDREATRADVLRVFARLDPPEAFSSETVDVPRSTKEKPATGAEKPAVVTLASKPRYTTVGILACIGGLVTLILGLPAMLALTLMELGESGEFVTLGFVILLLFGLPSMVLGVLYAIAIRQSQGQIAGLTCAAIGISALPISVTSTGMVLVAFVSDGMLILPVGFLVTVFAIVGAIHLTYRCLELFVRASTAASH